MPHQPVRFEFTAMPPSPAAEAAARRRLRSLEASFPMVLAWQLRLEAPPSGAAEGAYVAHAQAHIAGDALLRAQGRGGDLLGALRLAFNALEGQLEAEREGTRHRVARWLQLVRSRGGMVGEALHAR